MRVAAALPIETDFWQAVADALDGGATPGKFQIYAGPVPARAAAPTGPLLFEFTLSRPCATVADGVAAFAAAGFAQAEADGAPTFARGVDGDGVFVLDIDAGPEGSGAGFIFDQAEFSAGDYALPVSIVLRAQP